MLTPAQRRAVQQGSRHMPPEDFLDHFLSYGSGFSRGELPFSLHLTLHFAPHPFQHAHRPFARLSQKFFALLAPLLQNRLSGSVTSSLCLHDLLFVFGAQSPAFMFPVSG